MGFKQRVEDGNGHHAIGLEVHVDGWGTGPFFTVVGFDDAKGTVLLGTRYSRSVKYRVARERVYFTRTGTKIYVRRRNEAQGATPSNCQRARGGGA